MTTTFENAFKEMRFMEKIVKHNILIVRRAIVMKCNYLSNITLFILLLSFCKSNKPHNAVHSSDLTTDGVM